MNKISGFFDDIHTIIQDARQRAYSSINFIMVDAYWRIGKRIVEEEQYGKERAEYGSGLILGLAKRLTSEFGKGFTATNLKYFRQFYLAFSDDQKSHTLCDQLRKELSWSHYRLLMRVENSQARTYYIREAAENSWSVRQLERNLHTLYYERLLSTSDKKQALLIAEKMEKTKVDDLMKDPLILEFLGLPDASNFSETEFESAIIANLQKFLLELGKGFSFVGRQYRITTETKNFYIDLVFYNYVLKCFVLIDLKIGALTHQDIGQMDMYVRLFESRIKGEGDNPTIGIVLCAEKDETVVKFSMLEESRQLFATRYKTYLPTEEELRRELERERRMFLEKKSHSRY